MLPGCMGFPADQRASMRPRLEAGECDWNRYIKRYRYWGFNEAPAGGRGMPLARH